MDIFRIVHIVVEIAVVFIIFAILYVIRAEQIKLKTKIATSNSKRRFLPAFKKSKLSRESRANSEMSQSEHAINECVREIRNKRPALRRIVKKQETESDLERCMTKELEELNDKDSSSDSSDSEPAK